MHTRQHCTYFVYVLHVKILPCQVCYENCIIICPNLWSLPYLHRYMHALLQSQLIPIDEMHCKLAKHKKSIAHIKGKQNRNNRENLSERVWLIKKRANFVEYLKPSTLAIRQTLVPCCWTKQKYCSATPSLCYLDFFRGVRTVFSLPLFDEKSHYLW